MKASDWIDRVKSARGWESDYRVSKELDLSRQTVSGYRSGKYTMDDDAAIKVAGALGEPPEIVLIDQAAERAKTPEARSVLRDALRRLSGAAVAAVLGVGVVSGPSPAQASPASSTPAKVATDCILCKVARKRRRNVFQAMADALGGCAPAAFA